jgi:hypothetical protein
MIDPPGRHEKADVGAVARSFFGPRKIFFRSISEAHNNGRIRNTLAHWRTTIDLPEAKI